MTRTAKILPFASPTRPRYRVKPYPFPREGQSLASFEKQVVEYIRAADVQSMLDGMRACEQGLPCDRSFGKYHVAGFRLRLALGGRSVCRRARHA